jgi:multidrug efflux pump subunit AcrB
MSYLIRRRYVGLGLFTVLIFGSIFVLFGVNKVNLFPSDQTEVYIGRVMLPQGSDIKSTNEALRIISNTINESNSKYVDQIVTKSGLDAVGPNDPKEKVGENVGQFLVWVNDYTKNEVDATFMINKLNGTELPSEFGKIDLAFQAMENGPPVGSPVEGVFRSGNDENLDKVVSHILTTLRETKGIKDVDVNDVEGEDVINVKIDYLLADRLGLNVSAIGNTIRTAFSGQIVGDITQNDKDVDLFLRVQAENRSKISDLENLRVRNFKGDLVPLKLFAKFEKNKPEKYLKRYDYKRARTITANIDESIMTVPKANKVMDDAYWSLKKQYPDVTLTYGGAGESTKESMSSLAEAMVLALVGIFSLLVFLFKSYLKPVIIMTTIPLGFVGISLAFFLQSIPVSFMAMIGIIGLGGIIVNSGIVLVSFIEDMKEETDLPLKEILIKASGIRLRAVIVTALTTVSGLLPTAYGLGGADKFIIPLAMAMAWGLVSGTVLTLIWIPCAYAISEDIIYVFDKFIRRKKSKKIMNGSSKESMKLGGQHGK